MKRFILFLVYFSCHSSLIFSQTDPSVAFRANEIVGVYSTNKASFCSIKERIIVKLKAPLIASQRKDHYTLMINNVPYGDVKSVSPTLNDELHFDLTQNGKIHKKLLKNLYRFGYPVQDIRVSVANSDNEYIEIPPTLKSNFQLALYNPSFVNSAWILVGIIVLLFFFISMKHDMLRDGDGRFLNNNQFLTEEEEKKQKFYRTFSWSKTQLAWWTMIIFVSFIYIAAVTNDINQLNITVVILLGISAGTTFAGQIAGQNRLPLEHTPKVSQGFLIDILSEYYGGPVSVYRFQSIIFNFALGLMFLYNSLVTLELPTYDTEVLTLLGISSATYAGLKAFENQKPTPPHGANG